eukprot:TRINITY_DN2320_c0_g1_i1.p1 TRINITY_DN2320_c0_g1~~TRINITY_DN2320_c0_g1_i1.p1  ORF type:complete len:454 (-),score=-0.48 TRINITY_DN2320_c0_g1_i1:384-1604(-)
MFFWISLMLMREVFSQNNSDSCTCTDIPPPYGLPCLYYKQQDKCDTQYVLKERYCEITCGHCFCLKKQVVSKYNDFNVQNPQFVQQINVTEDLELMQSQHYVIFVSNQSDMTLINGSYQTHGQYSFPRQQPTDTYEFDVTNISVNDLSYNHNRTINDNTQNNKTNSFQPILLQNLSQSGTTQSQNVDDTDYYKLEQSYLEHLNIQHNQVDENNYTEFIFTNDSSSEDNDVITIVDVNQSVILTNNIRNQNMQDDIRNFPYSFPGIFICVALLPFLVLICWLFDLYQRDSVYRGTIIQSLNTGLVHITQAILLQRDSGTSIDYDGIIQSLPSANTIDRERQGTCAICLEELTEMVEEGDRTIVLPCNHIFHKNCIKKWMCRQGESAKCPLCAIVISQDSLTQPLLFP